MSHTILQTQKCVIPSISLTNEEILEFQQIVKKVKDIDLTNEEAENQATRMIKLVFLLRQKQLLDNEGQKGSQ